MNPNYEDVLLAKLIKEKNCDFSTPIFSFYSSYSFNNVEDIVGYRGVRHIRFNSDFTFSLFYDTDHFYNEIAHSLRYKYRKYKFHHMRIYAGFIEACYIMTEKLVSYGD